MRRHLVAAAAALIALSATAHAATILTLGQIGNANTIAATSNATGTTFGNNDIPVTITQIDAPLTAPISAFLDITATSTIAGATVVGPAIVEHFNGTFSVNSNALNTGINYLSGSFADAAITASGATAIAVFGPTASFASDVITALDLPRSVSIALTDVTPAASLVAALGTTSGETLAPFDASIAFNASAGVPVPEPASLAVLGLGILGLAVARRRNSPR